MPANPPEPRNWSPWISSSPVEPMSITWKKPSTSVVHDIRSPSTSLPSWVLATSEATVSQLTLFGSALPFVGPMRPWLPRTQKTRTFGNSEAIEEHVSAMSPGQA